MSFPFGADADSRCLEEEEKNVLLPFSQREISPRGFSSPPFSRPSSPLLPRREEEEDEESQGPGRSSGSYSKQVVLALVLLSGLVVGTIPLLFMFGIFQLHHIQHSDVNKHCNLMQPIVLYDSLGRPVLSLPAQQPQTPLYAFYECETSSAGLSFRFLYVLLQIDGGGPQPDGDPKPERFEKLFITQDRELCVMLAAASEAMAAVSGTKAATTTSHLHPQQEQQQHARRRPCRVFKIASLESESKTVGDVGMFLLLLSSCLYMLLLFALTVLYFSQLCPCLNKCISSSS